MIARYYQLIFRLLPALLLAAAVCTPAHSSPEQDRATIVRYFRDRFPGIALDQYMHGALMLSADAKSQYDSIMEFPPFQGDIDRGNRMWQIPFRNGRTYASCFPNGGGNVAGKYPYYDEKLDRVVTFEMAINRCRRDNAEPEFDYGDPGSMGVLTAYARTLSDGSRVDIRVDSPGARRKYEARRALYYRRIGQLNLACASCHITHAGNYFRDEILSPGLGQTTHFPVFRGGEFLFTLHMRYQRCMEAMRAVPFAAGSEELNNLEYFHSYLSNGLPLKASVYRK
ncbi:MAG: sulfur oxidation c-type cytochrome SoxA [Burkholderiales bacterium]